MTTKTGSALLVGAGERWNDDLYPILQEIHFDVVSLESNSDLGLRNSLTSGCFAAVNQPLGRRDVFVIRASADEGPPAFVR